MGRSAEGKEGELEVREGDELSRKKERWNVRKKCVSFRSLSAATPARKALLDNVHMPAPVRVCGGNGIDCVEWEEELGKRGANCGVRGRSASCPFGIRK